MSFEGVGQGQGRCGLEARTSSWGVTPRYLRHPHCQHILPPPPRAKPQGLSPLLSMTKLKTDQEIWDVGNCSQRLQVMFTS